MAEVFFSLGSNLGDRIGYLNFALQELEACGVELLNISSVMKLRLLAGWNRLIF